MQTKQTQQTSSRSPMSLVRPHAPCIALFAALAFTLPCIAGTPVMLQDQFLHDEPRLYEAIYTDSGDAMHGGCVIKVNLLTGERTVISRGGLLVMPFAVVVTLEGRIVVSDFGRLIEVSSSTGRQTLLTNLGFAAGLSRDRDGNILIAGLHVISRYDVVTGQVSVAAAGGQLASAIAAIEAPDGDLLTLNAAPAKIIRISKRTGQQQVIAKGGLLRCPQSLVVHGEHIYVADVATPDRSFGVGRIVKINSRTGKQMEISRGGHLVGPVGITLDSQGDLIVGDPYTVNPKSPDRFDGAIVRVNPHNGDQALICRGAGDLVNPRGIVFLPFAPNTLAGGLSYAAPAIESSGWLDR